MAIEAQGLEAANSAGIRSVSTAATGANWTQLPEQICVQVMIYNETGVTLSVRYCGNDGTARDNETHLDIPSGVVQPLRGLSNALQLQVRRADLENSPVTAKFVFESL